jgi:hypothetical protein
VGDPDPTDRCVVGSAASVSVAAHDTGVPQQQQWWCGDWDAIYLISDGW